jgi:5-formyltetrahydrofolate cyclo-ligase
MIPLVPDTAEVRNKIRRQRTTLDGPETRLASAKAASLLLATSVFRQATRLAAYAASNNELDPHPIIKEAWNAGKSVYLPIIREDNTLSFAPYHIHSSLQKNRYCIPEPVCATEELLAAAHLDLILVPLVAFDTGCRRIGMGAGYYDRTLAGMRSGKPVKAGLAYDFQRVDHIRSQPWDIPMDMIVTEQRIYLKA